MELRILNENFVKEDVLDTFISAIWTERYTIAGDMNIVVSPTQKNIARLTEGTFLWNPESDEVMVIETALLEDGQLKITGPSVLKFLDERLIRTTLTHADRYWNLTATPGAIMSTMVSYMAQPGGWITGAAVGIDGVREAIPGFGVWSTDTSGDSVTIAVPYGPLYSALAQIADTYQIGQKIFLDKSLAAGYSLLYKTYRGKDRTSAQSVNDVVQFSPNMDSLTDLKELRSIAGYKNVAYSYAPSVPPELTGRPGIAYADGAAQSSMGFDRRVLMTFEDDISGITNPDTNGDGTPDGIFYDSAGNVVTAAWLLAILDQRAKDALANNNYTKVVDGEIVPQSQYTYGKHYGLGDIVELQSPRGVATKARITEYIRAQDGTGERAYPTVSVID